jgi:hypothetical protein
MPVAMHLGGHRNPRPNWGQRRRRGQARQIVRPDTIGSHSARLSLSDAGPTRGDVAEPEAARPRSRSSSIAASGTEIDHLNPRTEIEAGGSPAPPQSQAAASRGVHARAGAPG